MARWATSDMPSARISPRIGMHLFLSNLSFVEGVLYQFSNIWRYKQSTPHLLSSPPSPSPSGAVEQSSGFCILDNSGIPLPDTISPTRPSWYDMRWFCKFCSSSNFLLNLNSAPWPADGTRYLVDVHVKNLLQVEAGPLPLHLLPPLLQLSFARDLPPHLLPADHLHLLQRILFSLPRLCEFLDPLLQLFRQMGKRYLVFNKGLAGTVLTKKSELFKFQLEKDGIYLQRWHWRGFAQDENSLCNSIKRGAIEAEEHLHSYDWHSAFHFSQPIIIWM